MDTVSAEIAASTNRLLATAAGLSDADVAKPSRLPGWTRGHVLTHLARNADGQINLLTWARTGVETPQYPSAEARAAGIEAGAGRPLALQIADLEDSAARLAEAVRVMPREAWSATVSGRRPPRHPAWYCLVRRLRELEVHHVDLDAGYDCADWADTFVHRELTDTALILADLGDSPLGGIDADDTGRSWRGLGDGPVISGTERDLLGWLTGRGGGEGLRSRPRGPLPTPPPWPPLPAPSAMPAAPPASWPISVAGLDGPAPDRGEDR
ncbi:maleylpyruvate isomerase family mycothiol-dependent enzyme [Bailinhaonella thermotolerans]|uniref:Maleylpyruvate isomerase family mycothiol-dependent enzyme n=1 Tax=Bailinhaonella thermotolerans TaxID=1070861 RepID=A0A3A4BXJ4_9ACTN|nr:maleylpyruvate isomerase family mycothiol-dependent enzyme [Bailinhaonella thermotolerans]